MYVCIFYIIIRCSSLATVHMYIYLFMYTFYLLLTHIFYSRFHFLAAHFFYQAFSFIVFGLLSLLLLLFLFFLELFGIFLFRPPSGSGK